MAAPSNAVAFYKVEQNGLDLTGNYNASDFGTPLYDGTIKHDDLYSAKNLLAMNNNNLLMPVALGTTLNSKDNFSISEWGYHPSTGGQFAIYFSKHNVLTAGFTWWYTDKVTQKFEVRWSGTPITLTEFVIGELNTWINWGATWARIGATAFGVLKLYKNNNLIHTNASIHNPFAANNNYFYIAGSGLLSSNNSAYADNLVFTDDIVASFPVVEVFADFKLGMQKNHFSRSRQKKGAFS